jgi:protocatechuate 3,4-dioxygenase beta subunit
MKRGHFLKSIGSLSLLPFVPKLHAQAPPGGGSNCILVPSETAGPFPLDLTANEYFFRQDIREDRVGVQMRQKVLVIGAGNCQPMPGVRVNIWHCDRDGNYSGYNTEEGLTYCRGYQITDDKGECEFITIVPGWYPGRVTHMHFQVHVSTQYSAVSQWTWPHAAVVDAVQTHADLYPEGPDPLAPEQDFAFNDGFDLQLASLDWDAATGEYVSEYEVTVEGEGTVGIGYEERRTAEMIALGVNYPNPFSVSTALPLELLQPAAVHVTVFDLNGKRVWERDFGHLPAGAQTFDLGADLPSGPQSYAAQVVATTGSGRYVAVRRIARM